MKYTFFIILFFALFSSCKEQGCTNERALNYSSGAEKDDGTCNYSTVVFWARKQQHPVGNSFSGVSSITLHVDDVNVGSITNIYNPFHPVPTCGSNGCVTFNMVNNSLIGWYALITLQNGTAIEKSGVVHASADQECIAVQIDQ
jgi:hypothetical protein